MMLLFLHNDNEYTKQKGRKIIAVFCRDTLIGH